MASSPTTSTPRPKPTPIPAPAPHLTTDDNETLFMRIHPALPFDEPLHRLQSRPIGSEDGCARDAMVCGQMRCIPFGSRGIRYVGALCGSPK